MHTLTHFQNLFYTGNNGSPNQVKIWDYSMSQYGRGCIKYHASQLSLPNLSGQPSNTIYMLHTPQCPAIKIQIQFSVNHEHTALKSNSQMIHKKLNVSELQQVRQVHDLMTVCLLVPQPYQHCMHSCENLIVTFRKRHFQQSQTLTHVEVFSINEKFRNKSFWINICCDT